MAKNYIVQIVAVDENNAIGNKDKLLFKIPADLAQFKKLTMGRPCIVGTKTIKTLPPLEGRDLIHLTRGDIQATCARFKASNLKEAMACCAPGPVFIIGGGEVYKNTLAETDVIMLTRILSKAKTADTYYPDFMQLRKPTYTTIGQVRTCPDTGLKYQFEIYGYQRDAIRAFLTYKQSVMLVRSNVKR